MKHIHDDDSGFDESIDDVITRWFELETLDDVDTELEFGDVDGVTFPDDVDDELDYYDNFHPEVW